MTAAVLRATAAPSSAAAQVKKVATPAPGRGELVVRVVASGV
eukprot:CAMPEP_0182907538 /NCGR_PEP_ID=MMETSP0034_2-20130328/34563_1 /TAXON_ID=156128 /ORGANISM="Nephroselmis pyriformis, Strain CCMP717" /LENGTH=41 /DNA_ID= /DNA_START= /DNA_END= /DNA_ORIENTATION=